jgi:hypothetical protein
MGFAFLLTWQNPGMDWHICKLAIGLAFHLPRYSCVRSSLTRRRVFFFGFWQVNFVKPLEIIFFLLPILILELANSIFCQTKNAKPLELLDLTAVLNIGQDEIPFETAVEYLTGTASNRSSSFCCFNLFYFKFIVSFQSNLILIVLF